MKKTALEHLNCCPETLRAAFRKKNYEPGEIILEQDDLPDFVYILLEGEAKVYHLAMNGAHYLEYIYGDGELFGEIEVLNGKKNISYVQARTYCKTLKIAQNDFIQWMKSNPEFSLFISQQLANKLYQATLLSVANIVYPLRYRVLFYLLDSSQKGNCYIPKEDIIAGLGSNERSINRIIRDLIDDNLIQYDAGLIKINNHSALIHEMSKFE